MELAFLGLESLAPYPESIAKVVDFVIVSRLFKELCVRLLWDKDLCAADFVDIEEIPTINSKSLIWRTSETFPIFLDEIGPRHFQYQEGYLVRRDPRKFTSGSRRLKTQRRTWT